MDPTYLLPSAETVWSTWSSALPWLYLAVVLVVPSVVMRMVSDGPWTLLRACEETAFDAGLTFGVGPVPRPPEMPEHPVAYLSSQLGHPVESVADVFEAPTGAALALVALATVRHVGAPTPEISRALDAAASGLRPTRRRLASLLRDDVRRATERLVRRHAYLYTATLAAFRELDDPGLAKRLSYLRGTDPALWAAMDWSADHLVDFAGAGIVAHLGAERAAGKALRSPRVDHVAERLPEAWSSFREDRP